jgi:tetratricopeptide (TPR) repeat protein
MDDPVLRAVIIILFIAIAALVLAVLFFFVQAARQRAKSPRPIAPPPPPPPSPETEPAQSQPSNEYLVTVLANEDDRRAVWAGAVPRRFNADILTAIAPTLKRHIAQAYSGLQNYSFVEAAPDGCYRIRRQERGEILASLWTERRDEYRAQAKRASLYFYKLHSPSGRLSRLFAPVFYRVASPYSDQAGVQIEWLYHLAIAKPRRAAAALQELATQWNHAGRYADVDDLLTALLEHAAAGRITGRLCALVYYFQARAEMRVYRMSSALELLQKARHEVIAADDDHDVRDAVLTAVAEIWPYVNRHTSALQRYEDEWAAYRVWLDRAGRAPRRWSVWDERQSLHWRDDAVKYYQEMRDVYGETHNWLGAAQTARIIGDEYLYADRRAEAEAQYVEAQQLYHRIGNHFEEANMLKAIGDVHKSRRRHAEALNYYTDALNMFRGFNKNLQHKALLSEAHVLKAKGDVLCFLRDDSKAEDQYNEALSIYHSRGALLNEADVLTALGSLLQLQGRADEARRRYAEALRVYQSAKSRSGEAQVRLMMGDWFHWQGDDAQALGQYEQEALRLCQADRDRLGEAHALLAIGRVQQAGQQPETALQRYEAALKLYQDVESQLGQAHAQLAIGLVYHRLKRSDEALQKYDEAQRLYVSVDEPLGGAEALLAKGEELQLLGRNAEAQQAYKDALTQYQKVGYRAGEASVQRAQGNECVGHGQFDQALEHFESARNLYAVIGDRANQAETLTCIAQVHVAQEHCDQAIVEYARAIELVRDLPPAHREAHGWHGYLALTHGDFNEALAHFEIAANRDKANVAWQFGLGLAKFATGLTESAQTIIAPAWQRANANERAEACRWCEHIVRLRKDLEPERSKLGMTC